VASAAVTVTDAVVVVGSPVRGSTTWLKLELEGGEDPVCERVAHGHRPRLAPVVVTTHPHVTAHVHQGPDAPRRHQGVERSVDAVPLGHPAEIDAGAVAPLAQTVLQHLEVRPRRGVAGGDQLLFGRKSALAPGPTPQLEQRPAGGVEGAVTRPPHAVAGGEHFTNGR
jgi:hypothetical protein